MEAESLAVAANEGLMVPCELKKGLPERAQVQVQVQVQ
jgi:hypothetical protein